jgi:hypothetical protein
MGHDNTWLQNCNITKEVAHWVMNVKAKLNQERPLPWKKPSRTNHMKLTRYSLNFISNPWRKSYHPLLKILAISCKKLRC